MYRILAPTTIILLFIALPTIINAQGDPHFIEIASSLTNPVAIANADDGSNRLFLCERAGRVRIYDINARGLLGTPFLDIIPSVESSNGEEGLLGIAFDPDYANNGYFYVNYITPESTNANAPDTTRISRFSVSTNSPNIADPTSEYVIMEIGQPYNNHNGGDMHFGSDGFLYISTGDGGSGGDPQNYAQDMTSMLGKILRLDVSVDQFPADAKKNYGIPASNPFVGMTGINPEIYHYGLRNPWRFSFDRNTDDMIIADVGQNNLEEVDIAYAGAAGLNFGWKCMEGTDQFSNTTYCNNGIANNDFEPPIFEYDHTIGFSITGGYMYRGSVFSNFQGWYFCTDYVTNILYLLEQTTPGNWTSSDQGDNNGIANVSAFGESEAGELYALSLSDDKLYRLIDRSVCPNTVSVPTITNTVHSAVLTVTSNAVVPAGSNLGFYADECVTLNSGFSTPANTQFEAILEMCGGY